MSGQMGGQMGGQMAGQMDGQGDDLLKRDLVDEAASVQSDAEMGEFARAQKRQRESRRAPRREQAVLPEPAARFGVAGLGQGAVASSDQASVQASEQASDRDRQTLGETQIRRIPSPSLSSTAPEPLIRTFESELDPFRFNLLDSGHFVLFRWAWRDAARYVQGALIEPDAFLSALIADAFRASALQRAASLRVAWGDRPLSAYGAQSDRYAPSGTGRLPSGTIVYRGRLQEPFGALRLEFDAARLPSPPGAGLVYWLGLILGLVLLAGTAGLYRLGLRQLGLVRQQQAFVAAVSHELKTPLTSIRMYAEMLREGWVTDDKRDRYYRYIHDESERLSRLVANVLQLARISRDELRVQPRPIPVSELIDQARAPLASQAAQGGFQLVIDCASDALVSADPDALTQVLINLVDNAIKFSAEAQVKRIEIGCAADRDQCAGRVPGPRGRDPGIWIGIRDHGPGIPKAERRRVFELFQRMENESTRDTKGTGIGLALVERLMRAMDGEVALIGRDPGIEVRLRLRAAKSSAA